LPSGSAKAAESGLPRPQRTALLDLRLRGSSPKIFKNLAALGRIVVRFCARIAIPPDREPRTTGNKVLARMHNQIKLRSGRFFRHHPFGPNSNRSSKLRAKWANSSPASQGFASRGEQFHLPMSSSLAVTSAGHCFCENCHRSTSPHFFAIGSARPAKNAPRRRSCRRHDAKTAHLVKRILRATTSVKHLPRWRIEPCWRWGRPRRLPRLPPPKKAFTCPVGFDKIDVSSWQRSRRYRYSLSFKGERGCP
jgi:hypothetical protein